MPTSPTETTRFDRVWTTLAVVLTVVILFGPMILVPTILELLREQNDSSRIGETTVGIGVILRAAIRRLIRSGTRNVMQTTIGTFARTSVRAATRRVVRIGFKTAAVVFRERAGQFDDHPEDPQFTAPTTRGTILALGIGVVGLFASFAGILAMIPVDKRCELLVNDLGPRQSISVAGLVGLYAMPNIVPAMPAVDNRNGDMLVVSQLDSRPDVGIDSASFWLLSLLAAAPILVYAAIAWGSARWAGVQLGFRTGIDSLLMQAYFTGAGSYLPLTTDSELIGEPKNCSQAAIVNLLGMLGLAFALWILGDVLANPWIAFAASMFLVYVFVFAFPIPPLDGGYIFRESKLLWLAIWGMILIAFLRLIPESFHVIV